MNENQYFSHEILNEQERLIVLNARRTLVEEINSNKLILGPYLQQQLRDVRNLHRHIVMRASLDIRCFVEIYTRHIVAMQYGHKKASWHSF